MKLKKNPIKYKVDISWSDEDRCYIARVPEVPGCVTDGSTLEEAAIHVKEASRASLCPILLPQRNSRERFHSALILSCIETWLFQQM